MLTAAIRLTHCCSATHSLAQLILRDEELTYVDEGCAQALASLEILSLSHNRLTSLEHFENFTNLIEVALAASVCN